MRTYRFPSCRGETKAQSPSWLFRSRSCTALCSCSYTSNSLSVAQPQGSGCLSPSCSTDPSSSISPSCFQVIGAWNFLCDRTVKEKMTIFGSETPSYKEEGRKEERKKGRKGGKRKKKKKRKGKGGKEPFQIQRNAAIWWAVWYCDQPWGYYLRAQRFFSCQPLTPS